MSQGENNNKNKFNNQEINADIFNTIACLYSEGQLSIENATMSSGLSREEFLERYERFKNDHI